jgi:signal transduction histidine kinase
MLGTPGNRKPTFFFQGLLIVLPVAVMAAVGLFAIRRDRAVVHEEARRGAAQLVEQLAAALAGRVPPQLAAYDHFGDSWYNYHWESATTGRDFLPRDAYSTELSEWEAANPGLNPEMVLPNRVLIRPEDATDWTADYAEPPVTPAWFLTLGEQQRAAWEALSAAESTGSNSTQVQGLAETFLRSSPPSEARANAQFAQIRAGLRQETALNGFRSLESFSAQSRNCRTESGLPLLSLVTAEALQILGQSGRAGQILAFDVNDQGSYPAEILSWILEEPSVLSPELLAKLERLVSENPTAAPKVEAAIRSAATIVSAQQRLHEFGEIVRQRSLLSGTEATNFWLHTDSGAWFCRANRGSMDSLVRGELNNQIERTNDVTSLRLYPKQLMEAAALRAIREAGLFIPKYVGLQIQFEGEPLPLGPQRTAKWEARPAPPSRPDLSQRIIRQAGYELMGNLQKNNDSPLNHQILATTRGQFAPLPVSWSFGQSAHVRSHTSSAVLDSSAPAEFTVSVYLANPELLFLQQRQRTWLFGGLILASMFAACVGLAAAYRSFRRQLRLNELKSNFVSSVSHELRAPIASVRLMAESLEGHKIAEPEKQQEYFHFIVQECRRLSSLIENVLDFSRIEQGRKQFEFEPTNIRALTTHTVTLMQAYATERQIALTLNVADSIVSSKLELVADGKALQQALVNLIDNAVKHTPKGGTVTVGLEAPSVPGADARAGRWLSLWVEDRGEGIPREEHGKIFERFYRLGSELRRETQGVGIGLSIVKHVVEAHGGRVLVDSTVGKGSRFTIELPLGANKAPA